MSKRPKFRAGDKVRLKFSIVEPMKLSDDVYTILNYSVRNFLGTEIFTYVLESDCGEILTDVLEIHIVAAEHVANKAKMPLTEAEIEALIIENMQKLDYWLDVYNDYMALYRFFRDEEFLKKALEARREWLRLSGELIGSDEPTEKGE